MERFVSVKYSTLSLHRKAVSGWDRVTPDAMGNVRLLRYATITAWIVFYHLLYRRLGGKLSLVCPNCCGSLVLLSLGCNEGCSTN